MTFQQHEQQADVSTSKDDDALSNAQQIQTLRHSLLGEFCRHDNEQKHVIRRYNSTRVTTFSSQLRYKLCTLWHSTSTRIQSLSLTCMTSAYVCINLSRPSLQDDSEKNTPTRIAISQKCVQIFVTNFACLLRTKLRSSVMFCAIFTSLTSKWRKRNEFRKWTNSWY